MLILASQSPRRINFLQEYDVPFLCDPAKGEEAHWDGRTTPKGHAIALACAKAAEVAARHPDDIVLAADTIVVKDGQIFGKPRDLAHAKQMLQTLSGASHEVLTGVAFFQNSRKLRAWCSQTIVKFRQLTTAEIDSYCQIVNVLDKAGAYAIQDRGDLLIEGIEGLWSNVVGLPIEEVLNELREQGIIS